MEGYILYVFILLCGSPHKKFSGTFCSSFLQTPAKSVRKRILTMIFTARPATCSYFSSDYIVLL